MVEISVGAGAVVAADARSAVAAVDDALLSGARMCVSVLEAARGSDTPAAQTQKVLRSVTSGLTAVVAGRGEIVSAIRTMTFIQSCSNLRETSFGCPLGLEDFGPSSEPMGADRQRQSA